MTKIIFFICYLLSNFSITTSVEINCAYSVQHYYLLRQIYSCVISTVSFEEDGFAQITGSHMADNNNDDVMGLYGNPGNILKLPKGLERFKNLKVIYLYNGQLRELHPEDLQYFPELVELYFDNNKIEVLEEGIFEFNNKLVGISFKNNRLFHISTNVFDHLTELTYLWLNGNICPNSWARNDRNAVLNLIATAKSSCQSPTILRLEKKIKKVNSEKNTPSSKSADSDEILDDFGTKLLDLKGQCLYRGSQALAKINDFELDIGRIQSELMETINDKFEILKISLNNCG